MYNYFYLFIVHFSTWLFLYFLPLLFALFLAILVTYLLGKYFKKLEKQKLSRTRLQEIKKLETIQNYSVKIHFILKGFFIGVILMTIILVVFIFFYEG